MLAPRLPGSRSCATAAMAALYWPTRRGAAVEQTSAPARAPLHRRRRADGHRGAAGASLLAAPIAQAEIERASPIRSRPADEISFDRSAMALRARRRADAARDHARVGSTVVAVALGAETARVLRRWLDRCAASTGLPWSKASEAMARPRDVPAQGGGDSWPDLSDAALAAERDLAGAPFSTTSPLKELSSGDLSDARFRR